jgi:nitrite reductase (cytochrome c-552)
MGNASSKISKVVYFVTIVLVAAATFGVMLLWQNISERKEEAKQTVFKLAELTEDTIDPAEWGKNFPRQYDSYKRTVDTERTRHGGSDAFQKLDEDPRWRVLFKGYAFGVDYREERGHAYMLSDQDMTERIKQFKQPGACLHCHSSVIPAYRQKGREAGAPDDKPQEQIMQGFEIVCALPYKEARQLVSHPVSCLDCHDPKTMQLRVTRPGFINGVRVLAKSNEPLPHLPSIERWRKDGRTGDYDPNAMASRQEMRSLVCGQCHVEYYFKGKKEKLLTYPWHNGIKVEEIESYYDGVGWKDWQHAVSGANALKAQHPEFELWSQGIHARSGVACADCHMPYKREGAIKVSDHHVRSPLLNISRACQTCHRYPEEEIKARVEAIQDRTKALMMRAEDATLALIDALEKAQKAGATDAPLKAARDLHRRAQWRLDFIAAENSMGFHAPQEAARILAEAIDFARQGQVEATKLQKG